MKGKKSEIENKTKNIASMFISFTKKDSFQFQNLHNFQLLNVSPVAA